MNEHMDRDSEIPLTSDSHVALFIFLPYRVNPKTINFSNMGNVRIA